MSFDEWFKKEIGASPYSPEYSIADHAWDIAVTRCIEIVSNRGRKIGGAIQPNRTISELEKLKD